MGLVGIIVADRRFIDWASCSENGSARRLSDGCPIRSSKSDWDDNPKAGWVREVGRVEPEPSLRRFYFLEAKLLVELIVRLTVDLDIRVDEVIERWAILLRR